jgi:hypothetical protein
MTWFQRLLTVLLAIGTMCAMSAGLWVYWYLAVR